MAVVLGAPSSVLLVAGAGALGLLLVFLLRLARRQESVAQDVDRLKRAHRAGTLDARMRLEELEVLRQEVAPRLEALEPDLADVSSRLDEIEERLKELAPSFEEATQRGRQAAADLEAATERFREAEARAESIEERLARVEEAVAEAGSLVESGEEAGDEGAEPWPGARGLVGGEPAEAARRDPVEPEDVAARRSGPYLSHAEETPPYEGERVPAAPGVKMGAVLLLVLLLACLALLFHWATGSW